MNTNSDIVDRINASSHKRIWYKVWVHLGVRTCEVSLFLCCVRARVYYVDLLVFFVLRHW